MSDWAIEDLPVNLQRFQHGVAEMLLGERRVAYLSSKVIGEGHTDGGVWVQEDAWTLQLRYVRTDATCALEEAEFISVSTSGGTVFGCAVTDLQADGLLRAVQAGWISFLDEPERENPTRYELHWLEGAEREAAWATYGWDGLVPW